MAKTHRCRKKANIELIPSDVLMSHILLRLPIKSLVCCMCVSKQWHVLLNSQTFAKIHLRHGDHRNKLLAQSIVAPCTMFCVIDCELDSPVIRPFPFKVNYTHMWFLSSCNGLIFLGLKKRMEDLKFSHLILWNPLTGDYKIISKANSPKNVYDVSKEVFEMYYTSCDDDYRLLHVSKLHDVYVYSLKFDSWRKLDSTKIPFMNSYICFSRPSVCLNENLYFLKYKRNVKSFPSYSVIIRFDAKTEKFTEIPTPNFRKYHCCTSLTVERGCIHLCITNHTIRVPKIIQLWKMNGEDGGWVKVGTYFPRDPTFHGCLEQFHLMRSGYWVMKSNTGHIYKVDLENRHEGKHFEDKLFCLHQGKRYDFHQGKRYIETFVSPNQYAK